MDTALTVLVVFGVIALAAAAALGFVSLSRRNRMLERSERPASRVTERETVVSSETEPSSLDVERVRRVTRTTDGDPVRGRRPL